jgi:hypothetical protein
MEHPERDRPNRDAEPESDTAGASSVEVHQPGEADRRAAERSGSQDAGVPDLGAGVEALRARRPSSDRDPNAPDRPRT